MATTGGTNNQAKQFGSGSISLKAVRDFFGGNPTDIKFSKYYRKADENITTNQFGKESSGHFVPDATENKTVKEGGNDHAFGDFRGDGGAGVIKHYLVTQSGSDEQYELSFGGQPGGRWNGNLGRNVPKTGRISGRCYGNAKSNGNDTSNFAHSTDSALKFLGETYNMDIDIDSSANSANSNSNSDRGVFGTGGDGGNPTNVHGRAGGTAMYVQQNSNRGGTSAIINVNNGNGRIFAGGGGGTSGRAGTAGNTATCTFYSNKNFNVHRGGGLNFRGNPYCNNKKKGCGNKTVSGIGGNVYSYNCNGSDNRSRCRKSKGGNRQRGESRCFGNIKKKCKFKHQFTGNAAPGGNAGSGGRGQGSANLNVNDGRTDGNAGTCSNCNAIPGYSVSKSGGNPCGTSGTKGNVGGTFGSNGAGSTFRAAFAGKGGHAVYSNTKSQVKVSNTGMARGKLTNVTT